MCSCLVSWWHVFLQVSRGAKICFVSQISRVGKNRDTRRETPAAAGAACAASHLTFLFSQKILAAQKGNCIYRPVSRRIFYSFTK